MTRRISGSRRGALRRATIESLRLSTLVLLLSSEAGAFHPQQNPDGIRWQSSSSETWSGGVQTSGSGNQAQLAGAYDGGADAVNPQGVAGYFGLLGPIVAPATPSPTSTRTPGATLTPTPSPTRTQPTPTPTEAPTASPTVSPTGLYPTNTSTPTETVPTSTPTGTLPTPTSTASCSITDGDYDLSGDGRVSADDLILLIRAIREESGEADLNCDGLSDAVDLFLMARKWEIEIQQASSAKAQGEAGYGQ